MEPQKKQIIDKLKDAKNILVTVSSDPSVDQLAALIGLTLTLNKSGKHAVAIFSGEVPSVLEFLKPEATLEPNTDSLRDFIIALDKAKADKLRYKVEDKMVRIFISPYKTSISEDDLEFSEGDFNVEVVIALGVTQQQDIDQAVTAQGNILHDATVITMTTSDNSGLGSMHWRDPGASGVSELAASLAEDFEEKDILDEQIATAFLTGIVAQTERFSNKLTYSQTMAVSAKLISAGADQQLVASELEEPVEEPKQEEQELPPPKDDAKDANAPPANTSESHPGELSIDHNDEEEEETSSDDESEKTSEEANDERTSSTNVSGKNVLGQQHNSEPAKQPIQSNEAQSNNKQEDVVSQSKNGQAQNDHQTQSSDDTPNNTSQQTPTTAAKTFSPKQDGSDTLMRKRRLLDEADAPPDTKLETNSSTSSGHGNTVDGSSKAETGSSDRSSNPQSSLKQRSTLFGRRTKPDTDKESGRVSTHGHSIDPPTKNPTTPPTTPPATQSLKSSDSQQTSPTNTHVEQKPSSQFNNLQDIEKAVGQSKISYSKTSNGDNQPHQNDNNAPDKLPNVSVDKNGKLINGYGVDEKPNIAGGPGSDKLRPAPGFDNQSKQPLSLPPHPTPPPAQPLEANSVSSPASSAESPPAAQGAPAPSAPPTPSQEATQNRPPKESSGVAVGSTTGAASPPPVPPPMVSPTTKP